MHVNESKKRIAAMNASVSEGAGGSSKAGELSAKQRKDSARLARTLFIIFIVFVFAYTPWSAIVALDFYDNVSVEVYVWSVLAAHGSSCVNWVLYAITNRQFRRAYVQVLGLGKCSPRAAALLVEGSTVAQAHSSAKTESSQIESVSKNWRALVVTVIYEYDLVSEIYMETVSVLSDIFSYISEATSTSWMWILILYI